MTPTHRRCGKGLVFLPVVFFESDLCVFFFKQDNTGIDLEFFSSKLGEIEVSRFEDSNLPSAFLEVMRP